MCKCCVLIKYEMEYREQFLKKDDNQNHNHNDSKIKIDNDNENENGNEERKDDETLKSSKAPSRDNEERKSPQESVIVIDDSESHDLLEQQEHEHEQEPPAKKRRIMSNHELPSYSNDNSNSNNKNHNHYADDIDVDMDEHQENEDQNMNIRVAKSVSPGFSRTRSKEVPKKNQKSKSCRKRQRENSASSLNSIGIQSTHPVHDFLSNNNNHNIEEDSMSNASINTARTAATHFNNFSFNSDIVVGMNEKHRNKWGSNKWTKALEIEKNKNVQLNHQILQMKHEIEVRDLRFDGLAEKLEDGNRICNELRVENKNMNEDNNMLKLQVQDLEARNHALTIKDLESQKVIKELNQIKAEKDQMEKERDQIKKEFDLFRKGMLGQIDVCRQFAMGNNNNIKDNNDKVNNNDDSK